MRGRFWGLQSGIDYVQLLDLEMFSDTFARHAQDLGLHREQKISQRSSDRVDRTLSLFWYNDYKKRVWIDLHSWDRYGSFLLCSSLVF